MIKVNTLGLLLAAHRLQTAATGLQALTAPAFAQALAEDGTSVGAAGRLDAASTALLASTVAHVASLEEASAHMMLIAAKFATTEEINKANLDLLSLEAASWDDQALATLAPVPPLAPDVRVPLPLVPAVEGEIFSQQIHNGSAARAENFNTAATNIGSVTDEVATTVRQVAATVPDYWDSPTGTAALAGRLNEHVSALNTISDRWFALAEQSRKHGDDYSQTTSATPKPQEFVDARDRLNRALEAKNGIAASQASTDLGMLNGRAMAEAARYAGVTEATTGLGTPQAPAVGVPTGAGAPAGAGAGAAAQTAGAAGGQAQQLAKTGATGAAEAGQAGQGGDQLAQMLPQALQAIGGMAGGMAGMAGQLPQQLMQAGQGLAQTAQQGLGGLMGKNASEAELAKKAGDFKSGELSKAAGGGGAGGGGGGGDTHPAGSLGPPVIPTASHTPPTTPSGAAPPPTTPTPAGGSAMGGMPMGMPMSGMMGHGQGGGDGADKVAADKKVVTPSSPHTEAVTGRVADRTAAAAEASRNRADSDSDSDDNPPPRGPVMRRITLAPLNDDRQ
jgi:hypothetical protein